MINYNDKIYKTEAAIKKAITMDKKREIKQHKQEVYEIKKRSKNEKQLLVPQSRIQIDRSQWKLTTTYTDKKFNFVYDKRVLTSDFFTYPFGY